MSRFIPEGKSDLKSLQLEENKASLKHQNDAEEEQIPSLYDQMKMNYIKKEQEYQDKQRERNQSHKIDEKEAAFYNSLKLQNDLKELEKKKELEKQLRVFQEKKEAQMRTQAKPQPITGKVDITSLRVPKPTKKKSSIKGIKKPVKKSVSKP